MPFAIASLPLLAGQIGICPMPGRDGAYGHDLGAILRWSPGLVLTLATPAELEAKGAASLPDDLASHGIGWRALATADFSTPAAETQALWTDASRRALDLLEQGGRVLAHCMGGCGRSGMALLRLMVEAGEPPEAALLRLRSTRPCAVETPEQLAWATRL